MKWDLKKLKPTRRSALFLIPVAAGAAALAAIGHITRGKHRAKPALAEYFGPLGEYDRVTVYKNGRERTFFAGEPACGTLLRLLDDLSLANARVQPADDGEGESPAPDCVLVLEHRSLRAAVAFVGEGTLRLSPPSGRPLVLEGDFSMAARAFSALLDGYCPA